MTVERAKLFDADHEPDLSRFTPRTDDEAPAPRIEQVRGVSAAAGFPNNASRRQGRGSSMTATTAPAGTSAIWCHW
jgi:hypothetical protein